MVLDFLADDNFDFTRKIVKKKLGENSWLGWIYGQKLDFSNSECEVNKQLKSVIETF